MFAYLLATIRFAFSLNFLKVNILNLQLQLCRPVATTVPSPSSFKLSITSISIEHA